MVERGREGCAFFFIITFVVGECLLELADFSKKKVSIMDWTGIQNPPTSRFQAILVIFLITSFFLSPSFQNLSQ